MKGVRLLYSLVFSFLLFSCGIKQAHHTSDTNNPLPGHSENQDPLDLFYISQADWAKGGEQVAFISLSDIHEFSEHPDSLPIPDISEMPYDSIQYMELTGKYRERFLKGTGVSENDRVFLYSYATGKQLSFPVRHLDVAACINIYVSESDMPFQPYYYEFGFGIDLAEVSGFLTFENFGEILVYVGKESPFSGKPLELLRWQKIDIKQFPEVKMSHEVAEELKNFRPNEAYFCSIDSLDYYVLDGPQIVYDYEETSRYVLILNRKTKEVVFEHAYPHSEGVSVAPLNSLDSEYSDKIQWAGELFKNRAPVVFGFYWNSFGCEPISFIGGEQKEFYINCDNRH